MATIENIEAIEIFDSRGVPTLRVFVHLSSGEVGIASVPSGASTGSKEALELRDGEKRVQGKGVLKAIHHVEKIIFPQLKGRRADFKEVDQLLLSLDPTPQKRTLGANAVLGVSLAVAKAAALSKKEPLYRHIGGEGPFTLPTPLINVINGGVHADNDLDIQEFMIVPTLGSTFRQKIEAGQEVFFALKVLLKEKGLSISVGDEGGFAPNLSEPHQALDLLVKAIHLTGLSIKDVKIALDCAASEFFKEDRYSGLSKEVWIEKLIKLTQDYPILSIEDPFDENDWASWEALTKAVGDNVQIVGDDLFVTQIPFLKQGIEKKAANAILIKPNQVGTLSETLAAVNYAKRHQFNAILSHRSGETEDTMLADIAVGARATQIKTGSLSRSERVAKYNRLLEIEKEIALH